MAGSTGDLHAWKMGMTGYPVVDACMRQLAGLGGCTTEAGWL